MRLDISRHHLQIQHVILIYNSVDHIVHDDSVQGVPAQAFVPTSPKDLDLLDSLVVLANVLYDSTLELEYCSAC